MGGLVVFIGDRHASTLARSFAVESAESLELMLALLGDSNDAGLAWGQSRAANRLRPEVPVEHVQQEQVLAKATAFELLVVDATAANRQTALWAVRASLLTVVAAESSGDDLDETMTLLAGLAAEGSFGKTVVTLCRSAAEDHTGLVRAGIAEAGYNMIAGEIPFGNHFRKLEPEGRAISESPMRAVAEEVQAIITRIQGEVASRMP